MLLLSFGIHSHKHKHTHTHTYIHPATVLGGGSCAARMRDVKIITFYKDKVWRCGYKYYKVISLLGIVRIFLPVSFSVDCKCSMTMWTLRTSADLERPDPLLTWSFQWGSYRRNAMSRDSPYTWPSLIAPKTLTFSAMTVSSLSFRNYDALPSFKAWKYSITRTWKGLCNLVARALSPSPSKTEWNKVASFQQHCLWSFFPTAYNSESLIYIHSRIKGRLFNLARFRPKTKVLKIHIR